MSSHKIFVHIIFDFDGAIGQINSSYPYNYGEEALYKEVENVKKILKYAELFNLKFTFAITGFTAEQGIFPFHLPELIQYIHNSQHEIASHTWRHEWIPIIQKKQIYKTFERSRYALENCIKAPSSVIGLVLPHNRPMSWYNKGAISIGDRAIYPFYPGADIGSVLNIANKCGYKWVRVSYRTFYDKIRGIHSGQYLHNRWNNVNGIYAIPLNYTGFDDTAITIINRGIALKKDVVICGHPLMISKSNKPESEASFLKLLEFLAESKDKVITVPVNQHPLIHNLIL